MRSAQFDGQSLQFRTDAPEPSRQGETTIRVTRAGLCETDLQIVRGYMGFTGTLGHEFVGIALDGRWAGRRVVGEINCWCGQCAECQRGLPTHCSQRSVLGIWQRDGAFADRVQLPQRNLHLVPDALTDDEAVWTEPVAAALQILEQVPINSAQQVIVVGDGRLGNLCAQVLAGTGCRLTVFGKHANKLAILRALGIDTVQGTVRDDGRVVCPLEPRSADVVVDCTGSASGLETALSLVRPRGTLVLKTTVAARHQIDLAPVVIHEVSVVGSRCGPFAPALEALAQGRVQVRPLIEAVLPLEQVEAAFQRAMTQPTLKLLLSMEPGTAS